MIKEIVVARYREDLGWLKILPQDIRVTVYNKYFLEDIHLPNIGREAHTYLYHIIKNYDNLADYTIFCQGAPLDHCPTLFEKLEMPFENDSGVIWLNKPEQESPENIYSFSAWQHPLGLPVGYFLSFLLHIDINIASEIRFPYGAQYIVHKNNILNRPKDFYEFLIKFLLDPSENCAIQEACLFERLWPYIFDKDLKTKDKYKYFYENTNY